MVTPKIRDIWASVKKSAGLKSAEGLQETQDEMVTQDWGVDRHICHPQRQLHLVGYRAPKSKQPKDAADGDARIARQAQR